MNALPCPFCGKTPQFDPHRNDKMYAIYHKCDVLGGVSTAFKFSSLENATKHWNTRHVDHKTNSCTHTFELDNGQCPLCGNVGAK